jgi:hypothetical protein
VGRGPQPPKPQTPSPEKRSSKPLNNKLILYCKILKNIFIFYIIK